MTTWLPITVVAGVHLALRLIRLVCLIWQERAHAKSNHEQIDAAAASGTLLYESHVNGTSLLIIPRSAVPVEVPEEEAARCELHEVPAS